MATDSDMRLDGVGWQPIEALRDDLKARFAVRGQPSRWALQHGVTDENILSVLTGRREPGPKLLAKLGYEREIVYRRVEPCDCYACSVAAAKADPVSLAGHPFGHPLLARMILCETCGNKRCPHAANHRLACTDSNDVGQAGSLYENVPLTTQDQPS